MEFKEFESMEFHGMKIVRDPDLPVDIIMVNPKVWEEYENALRKENMLSTLLNGFTIAQQKAARCFACPSGPLWDGIHRPCCFHNTTSSPECQLPQN